MPVTCVGTRDVPIASLLPFPGNAKIHADGELRGSAKKLGQFQSIVVRVLDDGGLMILSGHGFTEAFAAVGATEIRADLITCTDDEALRVNLAANRLQELAGYDDPSLVALLQALDGDFDSTGWAQEDLDLLLAGLNPPESRTDPDAIPEPPPEPVTRPGDLWQLGPHRLLCGDATSQPDQDRLLDGERPLLMATDPPYGVSYNAEWRGQVQTPLGPNRTGKVSNDDTSDWREVWSMVPAQIAYVWHGGLHAAGVHDNLVESGWQVRYQIIWNKTTLVMSRGAYPLEARAVLVCGAEGRDGALAVRRPDPVDGVGRGVADPDLRAEEGP